MSGTPEIDRARRRLPPLPMAPRATHSPAAGCMLKPPAARPDTAPNSRIIDHLQQQVLMLLSDLQRRYGMSYIFISHDLALVRAMSHRVMVMKNGNVVKEGEAEALFAQPQQPYTKQLLAAAYLEAPAP